MNDRQKAILEAWKGVAPFLPHTCKARKKKFYYVFPGGKSYTIPPSLRGVKNHCPACVVAEAIRKLDNKTST